MSTLAQKVEVYWKDSAPLFDLDPDRYEAPEIKRWTLGGPAYTPGLGIMELPPVTGDVFYGHETRHMVAHDCTKQILDDALAEGNAKLVDFVVERTTLFARKSDLGDDEVQHALSALSNGRENAAGQTRFIGGVLDGLIGANYHETLVHCFNKQEFHGNFARAQSLRIAYADPSIGLFTAGVGGHVLNTGGVVVGAACLGMAYLVLHDFPHYIRNASEVAPRIRKLAEAKPEIRKFHALGPLKNESLGEFEAKLDGVGALS